MAVSTLPYMKSLCYKGVCCFCNRSKAPFPFTKNLFHFGHSKSIRFEHSGSFDSILSAFHIMCGFFDSTYFALAHCGTWTILLPVLQKSWNYFFCIVENLHCNFHNVENSNCGIYNISQSTFHIVDTISVSFKKFF